MPPQLPQDPWRGWWLVLAVALIPFSLLSSLLLILLGSQWWWRHSEWGKDPLSWLSLLLSGGLVFVTALAPNWQESIPGVFNFLPFLMFWVALSQALRVPQLRIRVVTAAVFSGLGVIGLGLGQQLLGWNGKLQLLSIVVDLALPITPDNRPTSILMTSNGLAIYLVMVLCLAVGLIGSSPSQWRGAARIRPWAQATFALGIPLLALTSSRNGWGIACLALVGFLVAQRLWVWIGAVVGLCALPLGAAFDIGGLRMILPAVLWQRLADSVDPSQPFFASTLNRIDAWRFALNMVMEHPWLGWGWRSFPALYNAQVPPPAEALNHCHNLYLTLAAEGGSLIGLGFMVLWGTVVWRGWRHWAQLQSWTRGLLLGLNLALIAYFASGLLDVVFFDGRIHLLVWVLLAVVNGSWLEFHLNPSTPSQESLAQPETPSP